MSKKYDYANMTALEVYSLVVRGKIKKFPKNYLDKEVIKEIVRNLILVEHNFSRQDILTKVNHKFFEQHHLGGARKCFNFSDLTLLIETFPEMNIKYWEFKAVKKGFWEEKENLKSLIIWIAEKENLDLKTKESFRKITSQKVCEYVGNTPVDYAGGIFEFLDIVACGKYKKWEITKVASWTKEDIISATRWLIEEKLNLTPEEVCNIKLGDFVKNNLDGMLQKACDHSILKALEIAYPGVYFRDSAHGIKMRK